MLSRWTGAVGWRDDFAAAACPKDAAPILRLQASLLASPGIGEAEPESCRTGQRQWNLWRNDQCRRGTNPEGLGSLKEARIRFPQCYLTSFAHGVDSRKPGLRAE